MTWFFICVVFIPSFLLTAEICFQEDSVCWTTELAQRFWGDRQMRLDHVCWVEVWLSGLAAVQPPASQGTWCCQQQPSSKPDAAVGSRPGWMVVICPVPSVPSHGLWDNVAGLGSQSIWSLTAVAVPLWFWLLCTAHELMAGETFIRLAFLKEFINSSRCECGSMTQDLTTVFYDSNEPPSHSLFPPSFAVVSPPHLS